ncbi:DNA alkylation repair protein [Fannyhessea vaginae]|uniref:DNA alkylation repair protein n=1 Tax=Fannyhessea vaginae TaxID=82135 RepID=UPI003A7FC3B1
MEIYMQKDGLLKDVHAKILRDIRPYQSERLARFNAKLVPHTDPQTILGIRTPLLRTYANKVNKKLRCEFLQALPHPYLEMNMLHMIMLNNETHFETWTDEMETFIPFCTNWMVTDCTAPKMLKINSLNYAKQALEWLQKDDPWGKRIALVLLIKLVGCSKLTQHEKLASLDIIAHLPHDMPYYVQMGAAWYIQTLYKKDPSSISNYLATNTHLDTRIKKRSMQKIREGKQIITGKDI